MGMELFLVGMAAAFAGLFGWTFRVLPRERWQVLAAVPVKRDGNGGWKGLNLTYYGIFTAAACVLAVAMMLVLMGSIRVPLPATLVFAGGIVAFGLPATRVLARVIEKKPHTATIGGGAFASFLAAPGWLLLVNRAYGGWFDGPLPLLPALAAAVVAYAYGEGVGRLACISYGCCYGNALDKVHPVLRRLFRNFHFVFTGSTKKVAYEGGLEGKKVVPVQALSAGVSTAAALAGTALFLTARFSAALVLTMIVTQGWRFFSEWLRFDFRGDRLGYAYRILSPAMILSALGIVWIFSAPSGVSADVARGLASLWNPAVILMLEGLGLVVFLANGRSRVTGARLSFFVRPGRA